MHTEILDGPFLGINLVPGTYAVTVTAAGNALTQRTVVTEASHRELYFRF